MGTTIVRFAFRGVKVTPPFVELVADGVDPPPMIWRAEPLLLGH